MITRIAIQNYRCFREFDLEFRPGVNILVGNNETGKSTLLEAIHLALTGRIQGRSVTQGISPFLVNLDATEAYIAALNGAGTTGPMPSPPEVIVDLFLGDAPESQRLRGTNNLRSEDACGLRLRASLSPEYADEYQGFVSNPANVRLVPTEYYKVEWLGFSGNGVTARGVPVIASLIDPSVIRAQSGADYHLQQIIDSHLTPKERVELSRQYRIMREEFSENHSVKAINAKLMEGDPHLTDRKLSLAIDISQRSTWENTLAAHLDEVPFQYVGKGEQNAVKTLLAIGRKAEEAHVILLEEPENHLSHTSLRQLLSKVELRCAQKQVIIATHSSFVLNRLGLDNLILLGGGAVSRITDLPDDTCRHFKKLAGYDTLRLVLARQVILVEGPSDELIVQRAYLDKNGKLPIDDGIDVICVRGLSFKRYLDLAIRLNRQTAVVTDNDGKTPDEIKDSFADYTPNPCISIHTGTDPAYPTLEPQIVAANGLADLNALLGKDYRCEQDLVEYMSNNKTEVALKIFESQTAISMPEYILAALA